MKQKVTVATMTLCFIAALATVNTPKFDDSPALSCVAVIFLIAFVIALNEFLPKRDKPTSKFYKGIK